MLTLLITTYTIFWITLLSHEMGHYLYARKYNLDVREIGLGNGFPSLSLGKTKIGILPLSGYVEVEDTKDATNGKKGWEELTEREFFLFSNMSSLFQGIITLIISLSLYLLGYHFLYISFILFFNSMTILCNLLPIGDTDTGSFVSNRNKLNTRQ